MTTLRRRLLGLVFVVAMVGGVALSIAMFNKSFSQFTRVKLQADKVGNQLAVQSDVKVRGLIIGSVEEINSTQGGSELTLRLDPESAGLVPADVSARFIPKTLFGERFVSLEVPKGANGGTKIADGDVIPQDRSSSAVELSQAFENLLPVLQAVQPQKLNSTLSAISTALEGRGDDLGQTLSELNGYLGDLNPHLPKLQENLKQLATFSDNINDVAPEIVQTLDNLSTTSRTVVEQQQNLSSLYGNLTTASVDLRSFIEANSDNLINLGKSALPTAELLAKYSPEYPCVLRQMAGTVPKIDEALGKGTGKPGLRAKLEITANRGEYKPGQDEPAFEDKRGPRCYDMKDFPIPFPQNPPDGVIKDGSVPPPAARSVNDGLNPSAFAADAGGYGGGAPAGNPANTPAEHDFLSGLLGPQIGMNPADVPGWSGLLVGPLYRGAEVTVQ